MIDIMLDLNDTKRTIESNISFFRKYDQIFIICHSLLKEDLPMWVGWNSKLYNDTAPRQKFFYLLQINMQQWLQKH